jgi:hypothetical protein
MPMPDNTAPAAPAYLSNLAQVFKHGHTKVNVFTADQFPADLLEIFASLVADGTRIKKLEAQFFGDGYAKFGDVVARTSHKHFVAGIQALLGSKDHYQAALRYIRANCEAYLCRSQGLFNARKLEIDTLPLVSTLVGGLPNFCRNDDGSLRSEADLGGLIMAKTDTFVLVLSAIANRDSPAIEALAECIPPEQVFGILKDQLKNCPGIGLEEAFGHFFEQKTHVVFLAEMKALMASESSSRADFEAAFWPGASTVALDRFVSDALESSISPNPQRAIMLEVFREHGVDLYPGLVLSEKGMAHYLDAVTAPPELSKRQAYIMDVIASRAKINGSFHEEDVSALLRDIPVEILKKHPDAQYLFQELYRGTKDKSLLKHIENPRFKGKALEDSLGM